MKKILLISLLAFGFNCFAAINRSVIDDDGTVTISYTANLIKLNNVLEGAAKYIYVYIEGHTVEEFEALPPMKKLTIIDKYIKWKLKDMYAQGQRAEGRSVILDAAEVTIQENIDF